jgi:hypothetical protein
MSLLAGAALAGWPSESAKTVTAVRSATARERPAARVLPRPWRVRVARRWASHRAGRIAWAAIDTRGRLIGRHRTWSFPAASVSKAMVLVAELRRAGRAGGHLDPGTRALLAAMIRASDNDAADAVYRRIGDRGLLEVARAAHMRRFGPAGWWSEARLTPADQARLFLRIDKLVPPRWRSYARRLLASVVPWQSWGIARALRPRGWKVFFKGGWRPSAAGSVVHQVALAERGRRRIALAVLSDGNPSHAYGTETIHGIAARLLGAKAR